MYRYQVGERYHPERSSWPEGAEYAARGGGHELRLFLTRPSPKEIVAVTRGPAEFAVAPIDDIIFFLYRFQTPEGEEAIPWSDAPFSIHLEPEPTLPPAHGHALLAIFLVDAGTGILRGMRQLTLDPTLTAALAQAIADQARRPWPGQVAYDTRLARCYERYPTSEALLARAIARGIGGT